MYYIRALNLLSESYQQYLTKLDQKHQTEVDNILTGSVTYITRAPLLQLGEISTAKDFLEKGRPTPSVSLTVPFEVVKTLECKLRPGDFEYFQAEQAFDQHRFSDALSFFQQAQEKGSGIVDPIDITMCLVMMEQIEASRTTD